MLSSATVKIASISALQSLFYRGDYDNFIAKTADIPFGAPAFDAKLVPEVIGALTFVGRLAEAEALYDGRNQFMRGSARIEARFFLGVGFCRHSDYARARKYLGLNFKSLKHRPSARERFFAYQGIAFYRYFCGRFRLALRYGQQSLAAAVSADFLYGKAFAYDLVGHCLVQVGDVPAGLEHLNQALGLAGALGNGGLAKGFAVSLACFQAQFGDRYPSAVKKLHSLLHNEHFSDSYSKASLLLELSRQQTLRGDLKAAKKTLDEACLPIYGTRHRRNGALLGLRYSVLWSEAGEPHQALHLVRSSLSELNTSVDLAIEMELRGMQARLLLELGQGVDESLQQRIRWLTRRTGGAVGLRILNRNGPVGGGLASTQDRLGNLLDGLKTAPQSAIASILESGYHGLLRRALSIQANQSGADFGGISGGVLIYDRGRTRYIEGTPSKLIFSLAQELARSELSKEELVARIWKYRYHPLRHDAVLYRAISRLRDLLEPEWVEATAAGYRIRPGIELRFARTTLVSRPALPPPPLPEDATARSELNWRQLKILRAVNPEQFLDVEHCRKLFRVSEITARRDLSQLVGLSYLTRVGKGRATKYTLKV